ncbi:MAG TPA: hypothetical protein VFD83_02125 [Candidatus Polarisedimenticolia bacterium]|nr:hypothetical protein [Candidatus Polarisedimenticolia bacterium]
MRKEQDVEVTLERGGLGQLLVLLNGREIASTSRFGYPNPWSFMSRVREAVRA